ncbi:hypothetical protein QBC39DRAFT_405718 [Podospora conica]|nr:hypothetical protein QBC39DRAFT_405718 [Schizothecium conicum]
MSLAPSPEDLARPGRQYFNLQWTPANPQDRHHLGTTAWAPGHQGMAALCPIPRRLASPVSSRHMANGGFSMLACSGNMFVPRISHRPPPRQIEAQPSCKLAGWSTISLPILLETGLEPGDWRLEPPHTAAAAAFPGSMPPHYHSGTISPGWEGYFVCKQQMARRRVLPEASATSVGDHLPGADGRGPRRGRGCWQYPSGSLLRLFNISHAQSHSPRPAHKFLICTPNTSTRDGHSTQLDQPSEPPMTRLGGHPQSSQRKNMENSQSLDWRASAQSNGTWPGTQRAGQHRAASPGSNLMLPWFPTAPSEKEAARNKCDRSSDW